MDYKYKVLAGDTLWAIVNRFYASTESFVLEFIRTHNGLDEKSTIHPGDELKLPDIILYTSEMKDRFAEIRQIENNFPVEIRYSNIEGEPIAARRFIYAWQKIYPELIREVFFDFIRYSEPVCFYAATKVKFNTYYDTTEKKDTLKSNLKKLKSYYNGPMPLSASPTSEKYYKLRPDLSSSEKDEYARVFQAIKYYSVECYGYKLWHNRGVLMTDDWGQPWRIEEYIANCKKDPQHRSHLICSDYKLEYLKQDDGWYSYLKYRNEKPDGLLNQYFVDQFDLGKFAFYSPKEMEELQFVEFASNFQEELGNAGIKPDAEKNIDAREYFKPGQEFAFTFVPLDVIYGRDGYINFETITKRDSDSIPESDPYIQEVKARLIFPEILRYPQSYCSEEDRNIEELVRNGLAQKVIIPAQSKGKYSEKAIRLALEPNVQEYISLLNRLVYYMEKSIGIFAKVNTNFNALKGAVDELDQITHLMHSYPFEKTEDADYTAKITAYHKVIEEFKETLAKTGPGTPGKVTTEIDGHALIGEHKVCDTVKELLTFIKDDKKPEFKEIKGLLEKINKLLKSADFNEKLKKYYGQLTGYAVPIDYFTFQHPYITPFYIIFNCLSIMSMLPDEKSADDFYEEHLFNIENFFISDFYIANKSDIQEVLKSHLGLIKNFKYDIEDINFKYALFNNPDVKKLFDDLLTADDETEYKFVNREDILSTTFKWIKDHSSWITGFWNNQPPMDSILPRLIKSWSYFRIAKKIVKMNGVIDGINNMFKTLKRNFKLDVALLEMDINLKKIPAGKMKSYRQMIFNEYIKKILSSQYRKYFTKNTLRGDLNEIQGRVLRDIKKIRDSIDDRMGVRHGFPDLDAKWRAPAVVDCSLSSLQLIVTIFGIYEVCSDIEKRKSLEFGDLVKLISYAASGGLAVTGDLSIQFVRKIFGKTINYFETAKGGIRFVRIMTVTDYLTTCIMASMECYEDYLKGDLTGMLITTVRAIAYGTAAMIWIRFIVKFGFRQFTRQVIGKGVLLGIAAGCSASGVLSIIGLVLLLIDILIMIIEFVIEKCKTGVEKTVTKLLE